MSSSSSRTASGPERLSVPLSVVVTTYNNAETLGACLDSVRFADELLVLDSFSEDESCSIARNRGARVRQQAFQGYSRQKQSAIDAAAHDWVLLLDADEALTPDAAEEIRTLLAAGPPPCDAYLLPRIEQLFWTWNPPGIRLNRFLRLFDRRLAAMNEVPVHAAPESRGRVGRLSGGFRHHGEPTIHVKVEKLNQYSSGLVVSERPDGGRPPAPRPWLLLVYPPFAFLRAYLWKRSFLNGWAGFIGSVCMAFYAFLKVAKRYERAAQAGTEDAPEEATASGRERRPMAPR